MNGTALFREDAFHVPAGIRWRGLIVVAALTGMLTGCVASGGSSPAHTVTSVVVSGSRRLTPDGEWDATILVEVAADGEAIGEQFSRLTLEGVGILRNHTIWARRMETATTAMNLRM